MFDPRCVKCRDAQGQYFTYDFGDGHIWHFDVQRAAAVALAHPETLGLVVVTDLLEHTSRNEVDSNRRTSATTSRERAVSCKMRRVIP